VKDMSNKELYEGRRGRGEREREGEGERERERETIGKMEK